MPIQMTEQLVALFHKGGFSLEFVTDRDKKAARQDVFAALEIDLYKRYKASHEEMFFYFSFLQANSQLSDSLVFIQQVGKCFLWDLSRTESIETLRETAEITASEESINKLLSKVPFALGRDAIEREWINGQYSRLNGVFSAQMALFEGSVEAFLESHDARINVAGRVFFHLVENKSNTHPFAFLATYSATRTLDDNSHVKSNHIPLKNALLEFKNQQDQLLILLGTVSKAAQKSMLISELVESGELFSPLKFTAKEAYTFLKEIPLYETCGILCRMPDWWKQNKSRFKVSVNVGDKEPSLLGMEALMGFDAALMLGEDVISEEEVKSILSESSGLALIKGNWVEVDHEKLQATLDAYEKAKKLAAGGLYTMAEAMRLQLTAKELFSSDDEDVIIEVSQGQWVKTMMKQMATPDNSQMTALGEGFKATLRGYQQKGLQWLHLMKTYGFGACLADDMGLGKTVQVIALLEQIRVHSGLNADNSHIPKSLLVMPASLMGNWQRELEKFAPLLSFQLLYSTKDVLNFQNGEPETALYLTTYGMVSRHTGLKDVHWDLLILDEAQAIKNPGTKQTKAVKGLRAKAKIALTGTPIENSLSDLWSLFDFLNTGLLGTAKEFQGLTKKLRDGSIPYARLRDVVSPFILRRLKTDKTVIDTLPEKLEMKAYTTLTKKQIVLYSGLLKDIEQQLNAADGIARKGLVLASLMKFKQICNHPDQYLGQGEYHHEYSGKFERLTEICETIFEKRERVLVFTQFREMVEPISHFLEKLFKRKGLILHGGTPIKQRPELVDQFNGEEYVPFMVLSLKAGGVGLNLTAANHVIHFDRWWNPAVENQATDRAYRIGQERDVMVHKFITMGTIEEKIDAMIEAKSQLSGELISTTGEAWITELSNDELLNLFRLS